MNSKFVPILKSLTEYKTDNPYEEVEAKAIIDFLNRNDDALDRSNLVAHVTASSWIVNKNYTKVLMCFHNIYQSWSWTGGHADGDNDLLAVALREAKEETSIVDIKPVSSSILDVAVIPVPPHIKRGAYVGNHMHLNVAYLLMANENEKLHIKEDENSNVDWLAIEDLDKMVAEKDMLPIYHRLQAKALKWLK